ncbi:Transposon TX1 uncharacterized 149 kDa protein [Vitis vinifera]|uniref:Transposon TX1 uncharacterized 149 kDa protein n=1 Tax=Vitis vinifera TaxID=29760 RepID=A0A438BMY1_VITVI|nr:Transposon TX1 uncharacterized 149 kDa protein [Vitis vinifera]
MWLKVEGFKDIMKSWWEEDNFSGSSSFILAEKLKVLKFKLKEWNRDIFGRVEFRKDLALNQVEFWDAKEKTSKLSLEELEARKEAREEYKKWVLLEEKTWRQKSRKVWLKEDDRNMGFFHKIVNAHRRKNNVDKIRINGVWLSEETEIKEGCETLENLDAFALEVPFTKEEEEEVLGALLGCSGDKAPGPNGFSMAFWQFAWDFVKDDVMSFLREFYEYGKFVKSLNANFLVLIPKKAGAEDLRDFRPISLLGSLYKWLAKVLANRLKKVVGKVVSKAQGAFVEGRQILDAVLIANEAIDSVLKNNENGRNGLGRSCDAFPMQASLCWVVDGGFLSACKVKGTSEEGVRISHLLFVDDTLVFCQASQDHLTYLSWLLMWFEVMSRLRINLEKSELIPIGRVENIDDLALDFGCRVGSLPSTYLGLPLSAPFKSVTVWDGVEERFRRRKRGWPIFGTPWLRGGGWNPYFSRAFNDWEVEEAERFLERLHGKRVHRDVDDMVFWTETKSGKFSVKSLYLALEVGCPSLFPSSCIWNVWVQHKISFFAWEATWAKP